MRARARAHVTPTHPRRRQFVTARDGDVARAVEAYAESASWRAAAGFHRPLPQLAVPFEELLLETCARL